MNADFYDRSLPPREAQSICVNLTTGPNSRQHRLFVTIEKIWESPDSDEIAAVLN